MQAEAQARPVRIRTLVGLGMVGQISYLATQVLTLIALTRLASVEEVGIFGLASAIVIPVFFFFGMNMQVNVASDRGTGFGFRDFRLLLMGFVLVGGALIAVIGLSFFSGQTLALLLVLGVAKAAETFSQLAYGVFQRQDRMGLVATSLILRGVSSTGLFVLVLWQSGSMILAFLGQAAVWVILAVAFDQRLARRMAEAAGDTAPADRGRMLALGKSSLHLAFTGLLAALQGNMPRYVIAALLGVVSLGYFTVAGYAMQAIATLVGAVTGSLVARLSQYLSDGEGTALRAVLQKLLLGVAAMGAIGVGGSLWIGDWLIAAVFGPDYAELGALLAVCLLASSLQAVVLTLQSFLLAARRFGLIVAIRIGTVTLMFAGCAVGGLLGGLSGVVWGMCAAFCVHIVAMAVPVATLIRRCQA